MTNITAAQLRQAATLKDKIDSLQSELDSILGNSSANGQTPAPSKKRGMSAAGRARIVAAQKARWAKVKNTNDAEVKSPKKPKFKMSAAAKAKISAAAKARWAKVKAEKK